MKLKLDSEKLRDLAVTFYEMSGIRMAIYDADFCEIMVYPQDKCSFCRAVRSVPELEILCEKSDIDGCKESMMRNDIYIYKCHAGLLEAVTPINKDNKVIGYVMFGQITDIKDKTKFYHTLKGMIETFHLDCDVSEVKYRNKKQITAAAKIMQICTDYILLKEMMTPDNDKIVTEAKAYINAHIAEDIKIETLCNHCKCSRTKLYETFRAECGVGVAHFICEQRLILAKRLLKNPDFTVAEVSYQCGFCDYNYFSRVYKKRFGVSPRKDR